MSKYQSTGQIKISPDERFKKPPQLLEFILRATDFIAST